MTAGLEAPHFSQWHDQHPVAMKTDHLGLEWRLIAPRHYLAKLADGTVGQRALDHRAHDLEDVSFGPDRIHAVNNFQIMVGLEH